MLHWIRNLFASPATRRKREYESARREVIASTNEMRRHLLEIEADIDYSAEESVCPAARNDLRERCIEKLVAHARSGNLKPIIQDYCESLIELETARRRRRFSIATRQRVWDRAGRACAYCAEPLVSWTGHHMHLDHVVPFSKGGVDDESNLVASCPACNSEKSDDSFEDDIVDAIL